MRLSDLLAALVCSVILLTAPACSAQAEDTIVIRVPDLPDDADRTGRLVLFGITEQGPRWARRPPLAGPFYSSPQPIASAAITLDANGSCAINAAVFEGAFPEPINQWSGPMRVQAIFDTDETERGPSNGTGNAFSETIEFRWHADEVDRLELLLDQRYQAPVMPTELDDLIWISIRSELLSEFYGHDVFHRAGVALPPSFLTNDDPKRRWPAVYVIPSFGDTHREARNYALMWDVNNMEDLAPVAVHIVLDPESPLGHHGFVDSPNHGPRGTALVKELIPYLDERFQLHAQDNGRIVTGHSSGGWSSLWLQLQWPDVFGGCWSSAPDPVDFSAFQMTDLYQDASVFTAHDGTLTPSFRDRSDPIGDMAVKMSVREEVHMEYAMHTLGGSGEQWDTWRAMFSPRDEATGFPMPMFDPITGAIDRTVVEHWKQFDIARVVRNDWENYAPIFAKRVHLVCGEEDSFYLNRAVERLKTFVDEHQTIEGGTGSITLVPRADHFEVLGRVIQDWHEEVRAFFRSSGLHE